MVFLFVRVCLSTAWSVAVIHKVCMLVSLSIGHYRVAVNLIMEARLSAKFLL